MTSDRDVADEIIRAFNLAPGAVQVLRRRALRDAIAAALASVRPKPTTNDKAAADLIVDEIAQKGVSLDDVQWDFAVGAIAAALASVREEEREAREEMEEALQRIVQWADAYPLDIFPEPDFAKAHELLQAGGMTLAAISASNMRHVVEGVGNIARAAIRSRQTPTGTGASRG